MDELFEMYRGVVYPWQCDHMGHMNVMYYVGKFDEATWQMFASIGVTPAYMRDMTCGVAGIRQNISYRRELRPGDLITVRSGILEMGSKQIRFYHEMRNNANNELAATTIITAVHIDTLARKSCPFPAKIVEMATQMIVQITPVI